jgi:NNMT/PNMT/TEMT family
VYLAEAFRWPGEPRDPNPRKVFAVSSHRPPEQRLPPETSGGNADYPWDDFDSNWYLEHNYRDLRDDDRQIIELIGEFFSGSPEGPWLHGIDVGTGTNLYPMLAMLPLCDKVDLYEHSASNVGWLREEVKSYGPSWDTFWNALSESRPALYKKVGDPRTAAKEQARVTKKNIFDLAKSKWDVGTMFFVAESITAKAAEFRNATHAFVRSLRSGALFATAFMKESQGYWVGRHHFPALAVDEEDIANCLHNVASGVKISSIDIPISNPLRDGYKGMIVATGTAH